MMRRLFPAPEWLACLGCVLVVLGYSSDWRLDQWGKSGRNGFDFWGSPTEGANWAVWSVGVFAVVCVAALWASRSALASTCLLVGGLALMVLVGAQLTIALGELSGFSRIEHGVTLLGLGLGLVVAGGVRATLLGAVREHVGVASGA